MLPARCALATNPSKVLATWCLSWLLTVLAASAGCGSDGGSDGVCSAVCSCVSSMSDDPQEAADTCQMECEADLEAGANADDCRTKLADRGYPMCAARCDALEDSDDKDDEDDEDDEEEEDDEGAEGNYDDYSEPATASGETKTARQACHSDCDFSGYCWDVCDTVYDYDASDAVCTDGHDNDGDGLYDCADPECRENAPACAQAPEEDTASDGAGPQIDCNDGETIYVLWLCDGEADCSDGADEGNCENGGSVQCSSGEVIPLSYVCDGAEDCADGVDEYDC